MLEDFIKSAASFAGLKSLIFSRCPINLGQEGGCAAPCDLLPNLEELRLYDMLDLKSISQLAGHHRLRFRNLKSIDVDNCSQMKYLLYYDDFIQILPNLKVIKVSHCENLEELFNYDLGQNMALDHVFPKLRTLELMGHPKLRTLCRHEMTWLCLEQIKLL